ERPVRNRLKSCENEGRRLPPTGPRTAKAMGRTVREGSCLPSRSYKVTLTRRPSPGDDYGRWTVIQSFSLKGRTPYELAAVFREGPSLRRFPGTVRHGRAPAPLAGGLRARRLNARPKGSGLRLHPQDARAGA